MIGLAGIIGFLAFEKLGPCPDSVAVTKKSTFFKLGKEGENRGGSYRTIVDLDLSILAVLNCCQHNKRAWAQRLST